MSKEVWIALVRVLPRSSGQYLGEGMVVGWTNALSIATNELDFKDKIVSALDERDLDLNEIEDSEPLRLRLSRTAISLHLAELAKEAERTGDVRFGTFHVSTEID